MLKWAYHEAEELRIIEDIMSCNNHTLCRLGVYTPLPGQDSKDRWRNRHIPPDITELDVKNFLIKNPDVFEEYVIESVPIDVLQNLIQTKQDKPEKGIHLECATIPLQQRYCLDSVKDISSQLIDIVEDHAIYAELSEMVLIVARAVHASHTTVYIPTHQNHELCILRDGKLTPYGPSGLKTTVSAHVVIERKSLLVEDIQFDPRFPKEIGPVGYSVGSVICIPVILPSDDIIGVLEVTREQSKFSFAKGDLQTAHALVSWMTACLHESDMKRTLNTQSKLNDFLLETSREIFDEMNCVDTVVQKIMTFTKQLVNADRISMFLVDEEKQELYADYFDEGEKDENGQPLFNKKSQIRFHKDLGIAGYVARTGKVVNIYDAYEDDRFNQAVDKMTGYKTRSILCMPIIGKQKVVGVVQLINRLEAECFTNADENAFKLFAVYCALALHFSNLFNMVKQQQTQHKVAMEVLQYHTRTPQDEVDHFQEKPIPNEDEVPELLKFYDFCCYAYDEYLPKYVIYLLQDMFGTDSFELEKLCRFTLTVRKNYRPVTYHNWQHGFHVFHSLWCMVNDDETFSRFDKMAFTISGLCHDIDHRGYNNAFFQKLHLPLANLYSTSVMEQHHYRQTVTILQTEGTDIFSFMTADDYKEMLEQIRHNILATDLALYFANQKTLSGYIKDGTFDIETPHMRTHAKALMMTGADLCACAKPWATQQETTKNLYDEFYFQGDEEKRHGLTPIPMMDRNRFDELPKQQIGFIDFICRPLYQTLCDILPRTMPLLAGVDENRSHWAELAEQEATSVSKMRVSPSNE
ncbi:cAMP and cAMP-inhibited cGMP 3',5'-cyclic phosphodiesterase 10 [Mytilus galloprovincialis]|uniref:Phosphodiesterase n=1 Tax=Mytilus galloprovincialis TaxID=29158 RepID=A0A8B6F9R9_MYTGA|nr:cAMP and cAMP-inhibited cGMP 3',5'-cyclic phosphodiesterase 10 [Mytilus galloprovincialis]